MATTVVACYMIYDCRLQQTHSVGSFDLHRTMEITSGVYVSMLLGEKLPKLSLFHTKRVKCYASSSAAASVGVVVVVVVVT